MIDLFEELTTQGFKDAYNAFYNLNSKPFLPHGFP
jgi:hypothetical protein